MAWDPELGCRIALGLIVVSTLVIGLPFRLRADCAGGRVSPRVDPLWFWASMIVVAPLVAFTCIAFMVHPRGLDALRLGLPMQIRLLGAAAGVAGVALMRWMFVHLAGNVTPTSMPRANARLVTTGPYRWVRHPMYSAALILIVAATLLTDNVVVAVGGAAMFALLAARSRLEERRLVEKFGDAYRDYQRRTGRFLPASAIGSHPRPRRRA